MPSPYPSLDLHRARTAGFSPRGASAPLPEFGRARGPGAARGGRTFTVLFTATVLLGAPQPLPYSHKTHVGLGLKCNGCHTMPGDGEMATFPPESLCMSCHVSIKKESPHIQKLAEFARDKRPVPWVRVYRLPEYVWFSHKAHMKKSACETCHGPVAERDVLTRDKPITMAACMACHDETKALNECNTCHNP